MNCIYCNQDTKDDNHLCDLDGPKRSAIHEAAYWLGLEMQKKAGDELITMLQDRVKELERALKYTIEIYDKAIDDEYSGTDYLEELLMKADPAREVLKGE